jgi:hypothetical protein
VIEHETNIIEHLITAELDKIGHFSLTEYLRYLDFKVKLSFPEVSITRLKAIYLLRNIVAHNTGFVSEKQKKDIPKGVRISDNEILISSSYLFKEIAFIKSIVMKIELHIQKKFYKPVVK